MTKNETLPDVFLIWAEMKEAQAKGLHKEPVDMLSDASRAQILAGHADSYLKPTIEDLTR